MSLLRSAFVCFTCLGELRRPGDRGWDGFGPLPDGDFAGIDPAKGSSHLLA